MKAAANAANAGNKHKLSSLKTLLKNNAYGYFFMAPWIIGFLVFSLYPLLYSLYLSFTNHTMRPTHEFIGIQNYVTLITQDVLFIQAVRVTVHYVLLAVPLQLAFALILAMMLNRGIPGLKYFRAAYYLPALMGGSVAVAILWRQVFGIEGIFNDLLALLGLPETITNTSWIVNPDYAIYTLILLRVWQFGSPMIIFLAGLKQVPMELYESASLDGAGAIKRFLHVTIPMISPIILFNLIMQIISAFQLFTSAFIIGGTAQGGGIANSLLFYTVYLYRIGFMHFQMGMASAMAWMLVIIIGLFTVLIFRSSRGWVHYTD